MGFLLRRRESSAVSIGGGCDVQTFETFLGRSVGRVASETEDTVLLVVILVLGARPDGDSKLLVSTLGVLVLLIPPDSNGTDWEITESQVPPVTHFDFRPKGTFGRRVGGRGEGTENVGGEFVTAPNRRDVPSHFCL